MRAFEVDDTNPRIQYVYPGQKSEWITLTNEPDEMGLFNNTETSSHIQGALMRFVFIGMFTLYRPV
jgi:hypothetical protein